MQRNVFPKTNQLCGQEKTSKKHLYPDPNIWKLKGELAREKFCSLVSSGRNTDFYILRKEGNGRA